MSSMAQYWIPVTNQLETHITRVCERSGKWSVGRAKSAVLATAHAPADILLFSRFTSLESVLFKY